MQLKHPDTRLSRLDHFLADAANTQKDGMRLFEFVQLALEYGFRGEKTGELTKQVTRSLKKLIRHGFIHHDNGCSIGGVA